MRPLLRSVIFAAAAVVGDAAERPNILLILTDDQGWSQMSGPMDPRVPGSCSEYLETPNMDRLAREGIRFASGYSPAPLCTPTRRSIVCGTTAARSGSEFKSPWVPADHMTIPKALKAADPAYRCAHFGKWGEDMISTPEECGYDASDGMTGNNTGGMPSTLGVASGNHGAGAPNFIDDDDPKRTRTVTGRAVAFMREQVGAKRPFYVQASYYAVHLSVVCKKTTLEKYEKKGVPDRGYSAAWAAMMEELDDGVGRLLAALEELGISGNTYVFFTADNGGRDTVPGGDAARAATNHPLTGAKHSLYEGGIRVPFLARGPGIPAGEVCRTPVAGYDFLPTFFDLAGGKGPLSAEVDGASICPLLSDPDEGRIHRPSGALFFHRPNRKLSAIRHGDHKLMLNWSADGSIASRELYVLEPDPREEGHNIAENDPGRADQLQELLLGHLKAVNAETPKPPGKKPKRARKK